MRTVRTVRTVKGRGRRGRRAEADRKSVVGDAEDDLDFCGLHSAADSLVNQRLSLRRREVRELVGEHELDRCARHIHIHFHFLLLNLSTSPFHISFIIQSIRIIRFITSISYHRRNSIFQIRYVRLHNGNEENKKIYESSRLRAKRGKERV